VPIKDVKTRHHGHKTDYFITKELSTLVGSLALRCGRMIAVGDAALITAKHVDFCADDVPAKPLSAKLNNLQTNCPIKYLCLENIHNGGFYRHANSTCG